MFQFNLKRVPKRKPEVKKNRENMTVEVRKVLSQDNQGLIVMVRN